jgi:mannitol/fructose-specific phosphotransferase system IIA component (Ntr-type)
MTTARVTRKEAMVRLNRIAKQLQLARNELGAPQPTKSLAQASLEMKTGQAALDQQRALERAKLLDQLKLAKAGLAPPGKRLTDEQRKALEKLARSLKSSQAQQLLNLDSDLAAILAELMAKGDMQEALKILKRLSDKLGDPATLRKLTPEQMKQLAEEMRRLAEALKGTDLDKLAKQMLELAKALERGDLKLCRKCAGKVGGT